MAGEPPRGLSNSSQARAEPLDLGALSPEATAVVVGVLGGRGFVARCLALGFTPGAPVRMVQNFGHGPVIVLVRDTRVALGRGEARRIRVVRGGGSAAE